jgi:hypothetical protein
MSDKKVSVFGLFKNEGQINLAVTELTAYGFRHEDISALLPSLDATRDFAHEKHTKAPEGAAIGATSGAVTGGAVGLLLGLGVITIPGLGLFLAAGPIMAALAGAGVGGAAGTMTGALIGLGIPEYEARRYESFLKDGGYLLSVHCDSDEWEDKAKHILQRCGAEGIDDRKEAKAG